MKNMLKWINKDNLKNEHIHENEDDLESKELPKWINMTS